MFDYISDQLLMFLNTWFAPNSANPFFYVFGVLILGLVVIKLLNYFIHFNG